MHRNVGNIGIKLICYVAIQSALLPDSGLVVVNMRHGPAAAAHWPKKFKIDSNYSQT